MTLPPSGWFPAPDQPGKLRYWDGARWTEHVYDDEGGRQVAPVGLPPPPADDNLTPPTDRRPFAELSDIGTWMGAAFTAIGKRWRPIAILSVFFMVLPNVLLYLSASAALEDLVVINDEIEGFEASNLVPLIVVGIAYLILTFVYGYAVCHQAVGYYRGADPSLADSLKAAPWAVARSLGWIVVVGIGVFAVILVSFAVMAAAPPLGFLIIPALIVGMFWIWVKLSFLQVSAIVSPRETNILVASANVSKNRFGKVLGRLLLLMVIVVGASFVTNLVYAPFQPGQEEIVRDDGTLADFAFRDVFPSGGLAIGIGIVAGFVAAGQAAVFATGASHIYHESDGPVRDDLEGHDDGLS